MLLFIILNPIDNSPTNSYYPTKPQTRKHLSESSKPKKIEPHSSKSKYPKSSKNTANLLRELPKTEGTVRSPVVDTHDSHLPKGLSVLQKLGPQDYYARFGISKVLKLPIDA